MSHQTDADARDIRDVVRQLYASISGPADQAPDWELNASLFAPVGRSLVVHTREVGVAQPLHVDHCYAVIDVYEKNGAKLAKLYNPWGTNGGQKPLDTLIHEVKMEALRADCDALYMSGS